MDVEIHEMTSEFEVRDEARIQKGVAVEVTKAVVDITAALPLGDDESDATSFDDPPQVTPPVDSSIPGEVE